MTQGNQIKSGDQLFRASYGEFIEHELGMEKDNDQISFEKCMSLRSFYLTKENTLSRYHYGCLVEPHAKFMKKFMYEELNNEQKHEIDTYIEYEREIVKEEPIKRINRPYRSKLIVGSPMEQITFNKPTNTPEVEKQTPVISKRTKRRIKQKKLNNERILKAEEQIDKDFDRIDLNQSGDFVREKLMALGPYLEREYQLKELEREEDELMEEISIKQLLK